MKQETQFSLFPKLTVNQPSGLITLAEVHWLITTDATLKENTGKYRSFRSQGFKDDADQIKRSRCPAFTPAVVFNGTRTYKNVALFTGYDPVRIPEPVEAYEVYSVADVPGVINLELKTPLSATKVGMLLNKLGFKSVRTNKARGYKVCRYNLDEISRNRKESIRDGEEQKLPF